MPASRRASEHNGGVNPSSPARRALVVDDERPLTELVGGYLRRDGFEVHLAFDGPSGVESARQVDPDVIVLDLGLPGLDGVEVCRQIRTFSDCYVVMLTARTDEIDTLIGLSVGADDYVTKPFRPRELMARITAMQRRPRRAATGTPGPLDEAAPPIVIGPLRMDLAAREVDLDGEPVTFTRTEFDVLAALARRPTAVLTRRQLIEAVWGDRWVGDEHLVDVHVLHLRQKLGDTVDAQRFVRTVRGVGYRMGTGE